MYPEGKHCLTHSIKDFGKCIREHGYDRVVRTKQNAV